MNIMDEAMRTVLIEQLADAQMRGYKEGLRKGILMAEHFTGLDLTVMRAALDEAEKSSD